MLSQNDLQQIAQLLDNKLDQKLEPIQSDIQVLKKDVSGLKKDFSDLKKDVSGLKKDVKKLKKDQDVMLDMLDREQMTQRKKISRLEEHLHLPPIV